MLQDYQKMQLLGAVGGLLSISNMFHDRDQSRQGRVNPRKPISREERAERTAKKKSAKASRKRNRK